MKNVIFYFGTVRVVLIFKIYMDIILLLIFITHCFDMFIII